MPADALPDYVAERERGEVRWVWDDTTRWYPALLQAGARVARCTDLRLAHALLRRSPLADRSLLDSDDAAGWAALAPVAPGEAALFPLQDPAHPPDPLAQHQRPPSVLA